MPSSFSSKMRNSLKTSPPDKNQSGVVSPSKEGHQTFPFVGRKGRASTPIKKRKDILQDGGSPNLAAKRENAGTPFSSPSQSGSTTSNNAFAGMISKIANNVSILRMGSLRKSPNSGGGANGNGTSPMKRGRSGSFGESALHGINHQARGPSASFSPKNGVSVALGYHHHRANTIANHAAGGKQKVQQQQRASTTQDERQDQEIVLHQQQPQRGGGGSGGDDSFFYSFPRDASRRLTREEAINQWKSKPSLHSQSIDREDARGSSSFHQVEGRRGGESLPPSTPNYDSKSSVFGGGTGGQTSASSILKAPSLGRLSRSSSFQHKKDQIRAIFGKGFASSSNFVKGLADSRRNEPEGFATELFQAVESEDVDRVRSILSKESAYDDLSMGYVVNNHGFTPLDIAVMLGNRVIAKLLINNGAREAPEFVADPVSRSHKILDTLEKCDRKIEELTIKHGHNDDDRHHKSPNGDKLRHYRHHNGTASHSNSIADSSSFNGGFVMGEDDDNNNDDSFTGLGGGFDGSCDGRNDSFTNGGSYDGVGAFSTSSANNDNDALAFWERQRRLFTRMHSTYVNSELPLAPAAVKLEIAGSESLLVNISEPRNTSSALVTTYKVEWSVDSRFEALEGEQSAFGVDNVDVKISHLIPGQPYYVRVSAMNLKGYGPYKTSDPAKAAPSSWKEVAQRKRGIPGDELMKLNSLIDDVLGSTTGSLRRGEGSSLIAVSANNNNNNRDSRKRSFVKTMFASHSKMVKASNLRRGFYLSCLIYHENMILVSNNNDGSLPICRIDEAVPNNSAIVADLLWFMKVAATWEDVRTLQQEMVAAGEEVSDAVYWRLKLLDAAVHMQSYLSMKNLGQINYTLERDAEGVVILLLVKQIQYPNMLPSGVGKWMPQDLVWNNDFDPHQNDGGGGKDADDVSSPNDSDSLSQGRQRRRSSIVNLMRNCSETVQLHRSGRKSLPKGLHLGYLKLQGSMDQIRIVVPEKLPNVLPHCIMRNNSNVSRQEWQMLVDEGGGKCVDANQCKRKKSQFYCQLIDGLRELQRLLSIPEELFDEHRLYTLECIELDEDRSMLVVLPPADLVCDLPNQSSNSSFTPFSGLTSLPLPFWEMLMMTTYREGFMRRYSRISTLLDVRLVVAQQRSRQALTTQEMNESQTVVKQLKEQQKELEHCWKQTRWAYDMISAARSKTNECGLKLKSILRCEHPRIEDELGRCETTLDDPIYAVPYLDESAPHPPLQQPHRSQSHRQPRHRPDQLQIPSSEPLRRQRYADKERWTPISFTSIPPGRGLAGGNSIDSAAITPSSISTPSPSPVVATFPSNGAHSLPHSLPTPSHDADAASSDRDQNQVVVSSSATYSTICPLLTDSVVNVELKSVSLRSPVQPAPPSPPHSSPPYSPSPICSPLEPRRGENPSTDDDLLAQLHFDFPEARQPVASSPICSSRPDVAHSRTQRGHSISHPRGLRAPTPPRFFFPPPPPDFEDDVSRVSSDVDAAVAPPRDSSSPHSSRENSTANDGFGRGGEEGDNLVAADEVTSAVVTGSDLKTSCALSSTVRVEPFRRPAPVSSSSSRVYNEVEHSSTSKYKGHYQPMIMDLHQRHNQTAINNTHDGFSRASLPVPYSSAAVASTNLSVVRLTSTQCRPQMDCVTSSYASSSSSTVASIDETDKRPPKQLPQRQQHQQQPRRRHRFSSPEASAVSGYYQSSVGGSVQIAGCTVDATTDENLDISYSGQIATSADFVTRIESSKANSVSTMIASRALDGDSCATPSVSSVTSTPLYAKKQLNGQPDILRPARLKLGPTGSSASTTCELREPDARSCLPLTSTPTNLASQDLSPTYHETALPPTQPLPYHQYKPLHHPRQSDDHSNKLRSYTKQLERQRRISGSHQQPPQQQQQQHPPQPPSRDRISAESSETSNQRANFINYRPVKLNSISSLEVTTGVGNVSISTSPVTSPGFCRDASAPTSPTGVSRISVCTSPVVVDIQNGFVTNTRVVNHRHDGVASSSRTSSRSSSSLSSSASSRGGAVVAPGAVGQMNVSTNGMNGRSLVIDTQRDDSTSIVSTHSSSSSPSSLNVFAAYYHGLPPGQKMDVPLSAKSTVEDLCRTVVKHFNKMVILKGAGTPVYVDEELNDFYMVGQLGNDLEIQLGSTRKIRDVMDDIKEIKNYVVKRRGEVATPS